MPRAKNGSSTKIWVVWQKSDFLAKNRNFGPKKRHTLFSPNYVLAMTGKSCAKKKVPFSKIDISLQTNFGCFLGKKRTFVQKKNSFRPNVKAAVSPQFRPRPGPLSFCVIFFWPGRFHQVLLKTVQN